MPDSDFHTQMTKKHFEILLSGVVKLRFELYFMSTKW